MPAGNWIYEIKLGFGEQRSSYGTRSITAPLLPKPQNRRCHSLLRNVTIAGITWPAPPLWRQQLSAPVGTVCSNPPFENGRPVVASSRKLGCQNVDFLDDGWFRQELRSSRHECCSHSTGQMCLPARVVWECVKDTERRRTKTNSEPCDRCWLFLYHCQTATEKGFDIPLFSRFRLQSNKQRYTNHFRSPLMMCDNYGYFRSRQSASWVLYPIMLTRLMASRVLRSRDWHLTKISRKLGEFLTMFLLFLKDAFRQKRSTVETSDCEGRP